MAAATGREAHAHARVQAATPTCAEAAGAAQAAQGASQAAEDDLAAGLAPTGVATEAAEESLVELEVGVPEALAQRPRLRGELDTLIDHLNQEMPDLTIMPHEDSDGLTICGERHAAWEAQERIERL